MARPFSFASLALACTLLLAAPGAAQAQWGGDGAPESSAHAEADAALPWRQLPIAQQAALQPLAAEWDTLHENHRRHWLALARNFARLGPQEQARLHERMAEWTALSPRQRGRARLNYAEIQRLAPSDERKAQWEAYRALSDAEREALARRAVAPEGDARRVRPLPVRPVPENRLVPVPADALRAAHGGPRILLTPPTRAATVPADAFPPSPGSLPVGASAFMPAGDESAAPAALVPLTPVPIPPAMAEPMPGALPDAAPHAPPASPAAEPHAP